MVTPLRLRPLRLEDEQAARAAHAALAAEYTFLLDHDPDEPWEDVVARASIRPELNEYLATAGGHIGYAVVDDVDAQLERSSREAACSQSVMRRMASSLAASRAVVSSVSLSASA